MASVFWDAKVVVLEDYLGKSHTIKAANYAKILGQLRQKIKTIQCEKRSEI